MFALPLIIATSLLSPATQIRPGDVPLADEKISALAPALPASTFALSSLAQQDSSDIQTTPNDSKWYLRASGGLVTTASSDAGEEIDFDEGYQLAAEIGYLIPTDSSVYWTLGIEGVWNDQDADNDGDSIEAVREMSVGAILLNGTVNFPISDSWALYTGLGLGVAWVDVGTESDEISDFDSEDGPFFTWMARAGAQYNIREGLAVHGGYRFQNIDSTEIDDDLSDANFEIENRQHILEVGLTFRL